MITNGTIALRLNPGFKMTRVLIKWLAGSIAPALFCVSSMALGAEVGAGEANYPLDHDLGGPVGLYTQELVRWAKEPWPPKIFDFDTSKSSQPDDPVQLIGLETEKQTHLVGLAQRMMIDAPFERVGAALDDIEGYQKIFPDYKEIKIKSRDKNMSLSHWEQIIPVFFVPNAKFTMTYLTHVARPDLKFYRYKLKESRDIKTSDGLIGIEKLSPTKTRYTEIDFFDLELGFAASMPAKRIWRESLEGIYLSDLGLKFKAEHPDWDGKMIQEESRKILKRYPIDHAIQKKKRMEKPHS